MRHLMIGLAVSTMLMTTGVANARPPWENNRPAARDYTSRARPDQRHNLDRAGMMRLRQRISRFDRVGRPTIERHSGASFDRGAPNPFEKLEKAAVARAVERASAKAHHAARPTGLQSEKQSSGAVASAKTHRMPNPFAKLEKAAVAKAIRTMQAKAHYAATPTGLRSENPSSSAQNPSMARRAPNPFANLEKAAVAKAMRTMQAKAHYAASPKGLSGDGQTFSAGATPSMKPTSSRSNIDRLNAASERR